MDVTVAREIARDIDQLVGPGTAREMAIGGAYEGASIFDKSVALWSPPLRSADADILPEKMQMDARVRDQMRNDGYVQNGAALHRDNIVGAMYLLNARPEHSILGLDETWAQEFQQEVEAKFTLWAESDNNWVDAARTNTLTGHVRLAIGIYAAAGEMLATAEWMRTGERRPFKTAIQMVDVDRLSTPWDQLGNGRIRGGVRQDRFGAPLGYYIRKAHPSDLDSMQDAHQWVYVPVRKPWGRLQVIHIKEQMRADQTRGVADIVAGLKEARITKKFRDVTLQQAVIAASYAASIESDLPTEAVFAQMGSGNVPPGEAAALYAGQYLAAIQQYAGSAKHMQLDGVKIPHFFPGTKLQLRQIGSPAGVGQEFEQSLLRYLSSILGVSYEQLSHDYSKTNYSSARAAFTETWKFMQSRKKMVADRFASAVYRLWLEEALNTGQIDSMPAKAPNFYDGLNADAYTACEWIGAARGQIDELKETQAATLRIKYGLSTHEDELAKLGKDWRKVYAQLEREKKEREMRGIELEESNSVNAASGAVREKGED